ncbi:MAG: DUF2085 domain-containing protein [Rhodothermaceae bacterium]
MKNNIIRLILILITAIWIFGFSYNSFFPDTPEATALNPIIKKFYSNVCHQDDGKLCLINGHKLLVCPRCAGIYLGIFAGIVFSFIFKSPIKLKILILSGVLILLDVVLTTFDVYDYSKHFAFVTGLFFGISLFLYIQDVIFKIFTRKV